MKKALLLIMAVVLCTTLTAQHKMKISQAPGVPYDRTYSYGADQNEGNVVVPTSNPTILQSKGAKEPNLQFIGETHYNLATNSFSRNTVSYKPGTNNAAAVWTTATPANNSRGTGINYYNGDCGVRQWGPAPAPEARIETRRTGWGAHGFTKNGEVIIAHNAEADVVNGGLTINTRDNAGTGSWTEYILHGPEYQLSTGPTTGLLWPTMVTNGDVVHVVCVTDQWTDNAKPLCEDPYGYQPEGAPCPMPTVPLYYRSKDGGKTWDIEAHDFRSEGMTDYEIQCTSGDNFSMAIKGDHLVFLYSPHGGLFYMESKDGGNTWKRVTVYGSNGEIFWQESTSRRLWPQTAHACIDDAGKVHVVFSAHCTYMDAGKSFYNPNIPIGLIYWNEDRDPINWEDLKCWEVGDYLEWNWEEYKDYIPLPSVLGFDQFYVWEDSPALNWDQYRGNGWAHYVRIAARADTVYVSYQAPLEAPLIFSPVDDPNYYRGIFVTVSDDNGETWDVPNKTSWVSYHPDLFICDWSKYPGPSYMPNGDPIRDGEINIEWASDNGFPTMSWNSCEKNYIFEWYNGMSPICPDDNVFQYDPLSIYTLVLSLSDFPKYANISEVWKGGWQNIDEYVTACPKGGNKINDIPAIKAEIYPNPANEGTVNVKVDARGAYTITITNVMGQVVQTAKGNTNVTTLNISNLTSGVYIVNVKTSTATTSQKLIVK